MIEINIKNETGAIINKEIIVRKFCKCCNEIGYDVNKYILTEFFSDGFPEGYKIELYKGGKS